AYEREARVHFQHADAYPRIDVAVPEHRDREREPRVGRVRCEAACVESAPGCAANEAAGGVLPGELRFQDAGAGRAVLERRGVLVQLAERGETAFDLLDRMRNGSEPARIDVADDAAR